MNEISTFMEEYVIIVKSLSRASHMSGVASKGSKRDVNGKKAYLLIFLRPSNIGCKPNMIWFL